MKKSKITGDVAVMEVSHRSTMGSRTRAAKTLALQRLSKTTQVTQVVGSNQDVSSLSYLQLRNRRLEKLASPVSSKTKQRQEEKESGFREEEEGKNGGKKSKGCFGNREIVLEVGICCGTEQAMDFELRDRSTRESTPCSLTKDLNDVLQSVPSTQEMEEFVVYAEQQQHRRFMEKYNFDIVNDLPLQGRYEWVKIIP
ncbi:hypothetical protein ERO13_A08G194300v2 [Gossypium hirsutum]|uniref:Cyclin-dependent kinase inhibitor n=3 Tax=Gossypium TaxID=3633 RepID=A0A1U8MLQ3_GOSHI|nr:cyclin-dependent kinase inhibitor 3-like [Gossypium hirsutum]KAB2071185.1 hypothetical protein ES319_A08G205700v1 [Gossypium barbadense]KAG4188916.1 hypothetical protein ERO13_A08G194300v2 [Gossypium hirsutum]TYH07368.1 hypothetical protein ES288_A08G228200v1 [Gossypium darwinii]